MKKDQMTSRERVLCAMRLEEPDRVPWLEEVIDPHAVFPLMGKQPAKIVEGSHDVITAEEEKDVSRFLSRDNITYNIIAPVFCDKTLGTDGVCYFGKGHIQSEKDLDKLDLPDPTKDEFYREAEEFIKNKEDFAACAVSRLGIASTYLSMGMENFFIQAMDIRYVKSTYGDRVCIVGNIDVHLLAQGTPEQVAAEVKKCIRDLAPGGGYILSSGNSIPSYAKPENVLAMSETFKRYRDYPISTDTF